MKTIICFIAGLLILSSGCDSTSPSQDIPSPTLLWSFPLTTDNPVDLAPLIENGKAFIAHDRSITCAELETGKILWSVPAGNYASFSTPEFLHEGNILYFNHHNGVVRAFDKSTGNIVWQTNIVDYQSLGKPKMAQNLTHLFIGNSGRVMRLNKATGVEDLRIKIDTLAHPDTVQRIWSVTISPDGNYLYVPTEFIEAGVYGRQGNMLCYNAQTGKLIWGRNFKPIPIPYNGGVGVSEAEIRNCEVSQDMVIFPTGSVVYGLKLLTGETVWRKDFTNERVFFDGTMTIDKTMVYFGANKSSLGYVYAINTLTGSVQWITNQELYDAFFLQKLSIKNGKIVFGNGYITALDQPSGRIIWEARPNQFKAGKYVSFSTATGYDGQYIVNVGDKVYCFREPKF